MAETVEVINRFPEIIQALKDGAKVGVRQVAQDLTHEANDSAPYDVGFLAASGYYVASDVSTYSQAVGAAQGLDAFRHVLPEVEPPSSENEAIIAYAAEYAIYVHEGTRHMAARPWLAQTTEGARQRVLDKLDGILFAALVKRALSL